MKKKTAIIVNLIPGVTIGVLFIEILLLAFLIFLPIIGNYSLEDQRSFRIVFGVIMLLLLLVRLLITKMATFDDEGITFHKWFCFKKIGTVSYSKIKRITLITTYVPNEGLRKVEANFITIYIDGNSEKILHQMENLPGGLYWQIVATKHNLEILERYRKKYFPDIEIEDHRHKK